MAWRLLCIPLNPVNPLQHNMLPLLAIAGANVAANVVQPAVSQLLAPKGPSQSSKVDAAAFQKALANKIASSPDAQKAIFMKSMGISDISSARQRLGDLGVRILQDPGVQKALGGNTGPVEMRFSADGTVSIKTSNGQERTVTLHGDAKVAAQNAAQVLQIMQAAPHGGMAPTISQTGMGPQMPGIRITPGGGSATLLS